MMDTLRAFYEETAPTLSPLIDWTPVFFAFATLVLARPRASEAQGLLLLALSLLYLSLCGLLDLSWGALAYASWAIAISLLTSSRLLTRAMLFGALPLAFFLQLNPFYYDYRPALLVTLKAFIHLAFFYIIFDDMKTKHHLRIAITYSVLMLAVIAFAIHVWSNTGGFEDFVFRVPDERRAVGLLYEGVLAAVVVHWIWVRYIGASSDLAPQLTLCFDTTLNQFDRYLIDGVIFSVLGKGAQCRIDKLRENDNYTLLRLTAANRIELERVAEALYESSWRKRSSVQEKALAVIADSFRIPEIRDGLDEIRSKLASMSLQQHISGRPRVRQAAWVDSWSWDVSHNTLDVANPVRIYTSYSSEDKVHLCKLQNHLAVLQRQGAIAAWDDRMVAAGSVRQEVVQHAISEADIFLALVSPDFLATDHIVAEELPFALQEQGRRSLHIVPILVRPSDWSDSPLGIFSSLPSNGNAITLWEDNDKAWLDVTQGLRNLVRRVARVATATS